MNNPSQPTVEEGVNALLIQTKHRISHKVSQLEDSVRKSPGKAVLACLATGYILHRLPVRSLIVSQVRLMAALTPPVLLAFGAAKLCEFLQGQAGQSFEKKILPLSK